MFDQFIIIEWFRENTTGAVEDLGPGDYQQLGNYDRTSRYHKTAFTNQPYSPSLLGKYWCQVINITTYPGQPLMRSNVFTLLAPENYSGPTCILIQEEHNVACADLLLVLSSATQPTSSHDCLTTSATFHNVFVSPSYSFPTYCPHVATIIICTQQLLLHSHCGSAMHQLQCSNNTGHMYISVTATIQVILTQLMVHCNYTCSCVYNVTIVILLMYLLPDQLMCIAITEHVVR